MPATKKIQLLIDVIVKCGGWLIVLGIILVLVVSSRTSSVEQNIYEAALREIENYSNEIIEYNNEKIEYNEYLVEKYDLNEQGQLRVKITIHTEKLNTERIGNEISYKYSINGKSVRNGDTVTINILKPVEIFTEIRESDPSSDDVGKASYEDIVLINSLAKGAEVLQNIDVHESYGRSAGNTAKYQVSYTMKLTTPINISSSDLNIIPKQPSAPEDVERTDIDITFWQTVQQDGFSQIILICGACVFLLLTSRTFVSRRKELIQQYKVELETQKRLEQEERERQKRFEEGRVACLARLGGRSICDAAGVPPHVKFIEGGLPVDNNDEKYGSFTVYRSRNGTRYHCRCGCCSAIHAIHVFNAGRYRLSPCGKCGHEIKTPSWYKTYCELKNDCEKYGIDA